MYGVFLEWLAEEPKPWLSRFIYDWETRWSYWEQRKVRHSVRMWGALADTSTSDDGRRYALQKAFNYWKRMRYVKFQEDGERLMVTLTDTGRQQLCRIALKHAQPLPEGRVVLVLFDIPVGVKCVRDMFRRILKQNGFWQLQQSVWCIDRDVRDILLTLTRGLNIDQWIIFGIFDLDQAWQTSKKKEYARQQESKIFQTIIKQDRILRRFERKR